ncbi:MAG: hypothetical protein HYU69_13395 [Bacteroidetes bacterium]|nr:hypothetical protein [Bacteroidota bacterium]
MNKSVPILILILFISACGNNTNNSSPANNKTNEPIQTNDHSKSKLNIQTKEFTQPDSSDYILFPLTAGETTDGGLLDSRDYKESQTDYWNIIFYNKKTGKHHLLDDKKKMLIHSYDNRNSDYSIPLQISKKIFYTITTLDCNGDNKYNREDPAYLFVSDTDGKNFRQLTPDNYSLYSWQIIKNSNTIIMILTKDSDNNKKYEADDEKVAMSIDLSSDRPAQEVFSNDFKAKLKDLFDTNWKREEQ